MSYIRCQFIGSDNIECEVWFDEEEHAKFCILHRDIISEASAARGDNKDRYFEIRKQEEIFCDQMSNEALDEHIASIEKHIALEKTRLLTARAKKSDRIAKMTEEEREVLRKIKVSGPIVPKKDKTPRHPVTASIKNDPVKYLMQKLNCTEEQARKMLDWFFYFYDKWTKDLNARRGNLP